MERIVSPGNVAGPVQVPPSKSGSQRALMAALIHKGYSIIDGVGDSNDERAMLKVIRNLGAVADQSASTIYIFSEGIRPKTNRLLFGESGLALRLAAPVAALAGQELLLKGTGTLLARPVGWLADVLPLLGVRVESNGGLLPVKIQGPLRPADIEVDGSVSSQFITGLLFAFAAGAEKIVTITVEGLVSKPYTDITVEILRHFGYSIGNKDYGKYKVYPGNFRSATERVNYTVEGDWSAGAMLLVCGATTGCRVAVCGLDLSSCQGDKEIISALRQAGTEVQLTRNELTPTTFGSHAFEFEATDCPDLFPPLAVLAAACEGSSVIRGLHRLAHKESNRGLALQEEFGKMGIEIFLDFENDAMIVTGGNPRAARVSAHSDHRIAMACAVLALRADGPVTIEGAEAVDKSYPQFWDVLDEIRLTGAASE